MSAPDISETLAALLDTRSRSRRELADLIVAHEPLIVRALLAEAERLSADPDSVFTIGPKAGDASGAWGEPGGGKAVRPERVLVDLGGNARRVAEEIRHAATEIRREGTLPRRVA